jgi:hypothetical protein
MSVADIKETLQKLSPEERSEISNFLSGLRITEDPDYWLRIRRRMDDRNRDSWVPLEKIVSSEE